MNEMLVERGVLDVQHKDGTIPNVTSQRLA
jgi:hypothetical protein